MAVPPVLLEKLAASLRIAQMDPPLAQIGEFMRFGIVPHPALLRAADPDLVTKEIALALNAATPGSLTGPLPIPVEVPLTWTVRWGAYREVRRRGPGPVLGQSAGSGSVTTQELVPDTDFLSPGGTESPDVAFLFAPPFVTMGTGEREPQEIFVYAKVVLTADGASASADLGPVKVLLPPLAVPRLLALFRYPEYNLQTEHGVPKKGAAALLVVPADSTLGTYEELRPVLEMIRTLLTPLNSIKRIANFLLGVNRLMSALSRRPRLAYRVADRLDDLHKVKLITRTRWEDPYVHDEIPDIGGWPGNNEDNDIYAGNRMSSLILIGAPRASAECFLDKDCRVGKGKLVLRTGPEAVVMISSLRYPAGEAAPKTEPEGRAEVESEGVLSPKGFDDRISSLRL